MEELDFMQPKKVVDEMVSMSVIDDIKAEILSLKSDNSPNSYYVEIIDRHISEVTKWVFYR